MKADTEAPRVANYTGAPLEFAAPTSGPRSLLRSWPAFVLLVIVVADALRAVDTDLPGHTLFGHEMLRLWSIPRRDPYSYSAPGHPWCDHEWLAEVVMALIYDPFGVLGLTLMKFVLTATTVILIALAEAETGAPLAVQAVVLAGAGLTLFPFMQDRPQLFTFAGLAALLLMLVRDNYGRAARLWLAIPLLALWANLHGGFVAGIAVLATYSAVTILRGLARGDRSHIAPLVLLTGGATLATLANPYGIRLWFAVGRALDNPTTRTAIADWRPPWERAAFVWHAGSPGVEAFLVLYCACLLAMIAGIALSPGFRGRDLPLLAIAALMAVAGMLSARNIPLFAIAAAAPLARRATELAPKWIAAPIPRSAGPPRRLRHAVASGALGAAALAFAIHTGLFSDRLLGAQMFPVGAVDFMQSNGLSGNLLCDFGWGEYLIWRMGSHSKVFIDGRYDTVYPDQVIRDYMDFNWGRPHGAELLKTYPHDFVLVPRPSNEANETLLSKDWKLIYTDPVSAVFARAGSPAAAPFAIPVAGPAPSPLFP